VPVSAEAVEIGRCRIGDLVLVVNVRMPYGGTAAEGRTLMAFSPGETLIITGHLAGGVLVRLLVDGQESRNPVVVSGEALVVVKQSRLTASTGSAVVDPVGGGS
jgi:hypothetical protein